MAQLSVTTCGQRGHETRQSYCFCLEREGHKGMHRCADGYEWETKRRKPEAKP